MTEDGSDVYHEGEIAVQRRAGVRERAERMAGMVQPSVPASDDVRRLIADQPHAVVASVDRAGDVWVSLLTGEPGFVTVADDRTVRIAAEPVPGDPLADHLRPDTPAGVLLVDPRNRNRLRLNGSARPVDGGVELAVEEAFPNCPKYIRRRSFERAADGSPGDPATSAGLRPRHREWIGDADTFFIGSHHPSAGADASHRGGDPGFVAVDGDTVVYPDYPGNSMFATLGNVEANPRVGLLFVDFEDGRTLQLTGRGTIVRNEDRVAAVDGAERLVEIVVERAVEIRNGNPLRWTGEEYSPHNP